MVPMSRIVRVTNEVLETGIDENRLRAARMIAKWKGLVEQPDGGALQGAQIIIVQQLKGKDPNVIDVNPQSDQLVIKPKQPKVIAE